MKCFAYKGAISSADGDQFTDQVIVGANTMPRIALLSGFACLLACGSSAPKDDTTVTDTPKPTPEEVAPSDAKDVEAGTAPAGKATVSASPITIPNGLVYEGYILGGLPSKKAIDDALTKDIESAISLMASDEPGISEIGPYAASKGFRYIRFTISGVADLNESMAWQFASTLPLLDKPGIVHSANGSRVAAIFALMAFFVDDVAAEEALAIGQAIGLGDLEDHVREQLELVD